MIIALRERSGNVSLKSGLLLKFAPSLTMALVLLFASANLIAQSDQENPTGTITGTITAANHAPIGGAKLTITNKTTGQTSVVQSDAAGHFTSPQLPVNDYALHVDAKGFISTSASVNVTENAAAMANFTLDPQPVAGVLSARNYRGMAINNRNHLTAAELEPGAQTQDAGTIDPTKNGFTAITLDGGIGRSTRMQFDGLSVTDETVGTTVQNIPAGAVEEFRVGGSQAPISDQLGASDAADIITRSGTSELHGDFFGDYRNGNALSASLPGGNSHDWERQRYGGDLGGALMQDKLFVFISGERNRQNALNPVLLGGPFAVLPNYLTQIREPFTEFDTAGRLDYQLSEKARAFYRFTYDDNRDQKPFGQGPNLQSFLNRVNSPAQALGLDYSSGSFTHSLRFGYLRYKDGIVDASSEIAGFANPIPNVTIDIGGGSIKSCTPGAFFCSGPSNLAPQQTFQSNLQFKYDGTDVRGDHIYHFGLSYNRIQAAIYAPFYSIAPTLADENGTPLAPNLALGISGSAIDPRSYPVEWSFLGNGQGFASERSGFGLPGGGQRDNRLEAYGGDTWKIWPNLTVTYGVSWVRNDGKSDSDLGPIPQLNAWGPGLSGSVRLPDYNFGPQVGAAWDPHNTGKTLLRAGVGLYYDNEIFNNLLFDRPLRLEQGKFFATPAACVGGAPGSIQWPTSAGAAGTLVASGAGIVNADGTVSPTWCGAAIGVAAPQAVALQQAYQAATAAATGVNPSFIGNTGAFAGPYANGLSLLAPNYQTPRTLNMAAGLQHELHPGLIFSADYVRNVTTRTLLGIDVNQGGAATTFDAANAVADRDAAQVANGCPGGTNQVSCMVGKLGPEGALRAYGAAGIGGPAQVTGGAPCPFCAFPGLQPSLGVNVMNFPVGRSVYSGAQVSLREVVRNFSVRGFQRATFIISYAHSRDVGQVPDPTIANQAVDFIDPTRFTGPTSLDRTHQVSFGALFDLQRSLELSFTGHFMSPLPVTLTLPQNSGGAEVLVTDVTGDGTTGDIVPGSKVGSYMRGIKPGSLATFIQNYNSTVAGAANPATPAGTMLVDGGVFSLAELEQMGGVQQPLAAPVLDVAGLSWLKTFDVRLGWSHTYKDRITVQPSVSLFNAFNFANFDLSGNTQNGVLNFGAASLSPFSTVFQPQNTVGGTSANSQELFGRTNRASLGSDLNAQGAPRTLEFGLRISF
jgi:Carboxypeptidase regulatory-like domain